jgi:hypothetical protein
MFYKLKAFVNKLCLALPLNRAKERIKARKETIYVTSLVLMFVLC